MRVALLSPFSIGPLRGNIITVQRVAHYLPATGWETATIPLDTNDYQACKLIADRYQPDLLHAFHALQSAPLARTLARQSGLPYLVTMTGSDLYEPSLLHHPDTSLALNDAAAIICFDTLAVAQLNSAYPHLTGRVTVIPQGVEPLTTDQPFPRTAEELIILLPAALRPVKGVLEAMEALSPLAAERPQLKLWLAGGDLDPQYAALVRQQASTRPWVRLLGEVPHERMGDLYAACDLVLNNSRFEGGMANTLLEAMAAAKPVVACDVPGNRSLITHAVTGWLFSDHQELSGLIRRLGNDSCLRIKAGQAARAQVLHRFSPQHEAAALAALYRQTLATHRT